VWGLSAQPIEEQTAFAARMHIPFPLLNDSALALSTSDLALPTFDAGGMTLYRRLTLIASAAGIAIVFYPVFPPDQDAADVIHYLKGLRAGSA
jgi:peroxiredoxin